MTKEKAVAEGETGRTVEESCERIGRELSNILRTLGPSDEVLTHFRAARVEVLKGLRAAIDARIEQVTEPQRKGRSVKVE